MRPFLLWCGLAALAVLFAVWLVTGAKAQVPATPTAVVVRMSDGTTQDYPLGIYLLFQAGKLRGIFPTQYVNQYAIRQPFTTVDDLAWKLNRPGRNVQVWRNGVTQMPYSGATMLCAQPYKKFVVKQDSSGRWFADFADPAATDVTQIPYGDYTLTADVIKPRYRDGTGKPYATCDGDLLTSWSPNDLIQTAYLY